DRIAPAALAGGLVADRGVPDDEKGGFRPRRGGEAGGEEHSEKDTHERAASRIRSALSRPPYGVKTMRAGGPIPRPRERASPAPSARKEAGLSRRHRRVCNRCSRS